MNHSIPDLFRMTGTRTGGRTVLRLGLAVAALLLAGGGPVPQAVAQPQQPTITPTEIYEGESVTFTIDLNASGYVNYVYRLMYPNGGGSTISLEDVRNGYTFSADPDLTGAGTRNATFPASGYSFIRMNWKTEFSFVVTAGANAVDKDETLVLLVYGDDDYSSYSIPAITLKDGSRLATDGVTISESTLPLTEGHA
ncbi:MAG: hypothetical protein F4X50_09105, partial [Synechococcus sp. SB0662_bin_14]|nr:hypothetical protein [Synechococcus sp. SB0662_bin_14]